MFKPTPQHRDIAHALLKEHRIARDNLPYSNEFLELHIEFGHKSGLMPGDWPNYQQFWKLLCGAAKRGGLAKEPKEDAA